MAAALGMFGGFGKKTIFSSMQFFRDLLLWTEVEILHSNDSHELTFSIGTSS